MSLEKQIEQLNQSIVNLVGAVDANTHATLAMIEAYSPGGTGKAIKKVAEKEAPAEKVVEPEEEEVVEAQAEEVVEEPTVDLASLKKAFVELVNTYDGAAMAEILTNYNAKKISELETVVYPQVMADIQAKLEKA